MNAPDLAHTFAEHLPEMAVPGQAATFPTPRIEVLNEPLARELGLDPTWLRTEEGTGWLAGATGGHATAYAGHQFGQFVPLLGDGRALLLGDVTGHEIQLKGSGPTPFSRPGSDGLGALGPMLREHLVSEFMHAVGVPTTRSLAVLSTGQKIMRRQGVVPGGIEVRVARSHLRVGSIQYAAMRSATLLSSVVTAAGFSGPDELLREVIERQLRLVAQWMRLGFVHGVMNTDNTTLSGETIDYGPCAFTENRNPSAVFSSIDVGGRYAFGNQPAVIAWNLTQLAEALLPLIGERAAQGALSTIDERWDHYWLSIPEQQPVFLPRNWMLDRALTTAERDGDLTPFLELLAAVTDPFNPDAGPGWMATPESEDGQFITYCGT
ncbi:hypothetical protein CAPI_04535 [Corynebacterium capitovis DSM 44611]|uniref:protein adenylyltransferase SelO family protein n=1 Tax=Corynebacterium capitovis TaxID=131081 RepID=UPI00036313DC|nr:protein adenylyltransferase SelO family protein [Corynebacterium capitovis]WKD57465.1 hypothetical protein CAPI_04535 [Corynebacterium capitovis DSM 44611]